MDTTQETTQIAAELNKLPKPTSYNSLYLLAQQAFENGFRAMTVNELVIYLSKNLPDDLTRSEFIYEKFAPGSALPDPGRKASVFLGAGTYTTPGGGPALELSENFNVVSWDGEKWVKVIEVPIEVPEPETISEINPSILDKAVNGKAVADYIDPKLEGIEPNKEILIATITHDNTLTGNYASSTGLPVDQTNLYRRTNKYIYEGNGTLRFEGLPRKFGIFCWDKNNNYLGFVVPLVFDGEQALLPNTYYFATNTEHPTLQPLTDYEIKFYGYTQNIKNAIDKNNEVLNNKIDAVGAKLDGIPSSDAPLFTATYDNSLNGYYDGGTGAVIYPDDSRFKRTPLIPIPAGVDVINYEGLLYLFSFVFYDKDQVFIGSIVPSDYSGSVNKLENAKYIGTITRHNTLQKNNNFTIKFTFERVNVYDYIQSVLGQNNKPAVEFKGVTVFAKDFEGTDIERIQSAIDLLSISNKGGFVVLSDQDWIINTAIIIRSNIYLIIDGCKLKLADGVFDNIIRTDSINVNPANPNGLALSLGLTENIKILGVNNGIIEGADIPYTAANPKTGVVQPWVGDWYGWRTIGILLANTKGYEIAGFTMQKTHCWAISQEWGCEGMDIHDLFFNTTVKNGDGIDFRNGCKHGKVYNISGSTSDDGVAMTALDASFNWQSPEVPYIFPLQTMGFDYKTGEEASIHDIEFENINVSGSYHTIICLSTSNQVYNISMNKISDGHSGSQKLEVVKLYTGYGSGYVDGNIHNISINDIKSYNANIALDIDARVSNVKANFLRQHKATGATHTVSTGSVNVEVTNALKV